MRKQILENDSIIIKKENKILFLTWKETNIDLSIAQKLVKYRLEASKGKTYAICTDIISVRKTTKEARDYFASEIAFKGTVACAIIIDSPVGRIIGNFYLQISKPKNPAKLFTDEAEAIIWLKTFI